jgi:hypothetical protein
MLRKYPTYTGGKISITPLLELINPALNFNLVYLLAFFILLVILIFGLWNWGKGKFSDLALLAYGSFFTYFFHPTGISYEQIIFLLPVIFWIIKISRINQTFSIFAWGLLISFSWIFFVASRFGKLSDFSSSGLFLIFFIWLIFGLILPPRFLKGMGIP